jgi:Lrp/AsnC family transcriptional regulator for asnA, asnC and gidA
MLDKIDQGIIQELQKDGRLSYREIARKLDVTEGTIRVRVRNLRSGNILKITAVLDPAKLGYDFICIMGLEVRLTDLEEVGDKLAKSPNVYYLTDTTGHFDMLAILLFHNAQELADFIRETLSTMPGVVRTETFVNMNIRKNPGVNQLDVASLL